MKDLLFITLVLSLCTSSRAHALDFAVRLGQGGLVEERAPDGKLGGGQLALDIKLGKLPLAISVSSEYHTKDPVADSTYEIGELFAVNLFYTRSLLENWNSNIFLGGGIGTLRTPRIGEPEIIERGFLFDLEGGVNIKLFWKLGLYTVGKYLYSRKSRDDVKIIDFSNIGFFVGLSYNSDW